MRAWILLGLLACGQRAAETPPAPTGEHWRGDFSPPPAADAEVVATVNGERIYAADVARQARAEGQTPRAALDALIDAELLAQEARRRGLTDAPEVVEARKRARVRRFVDEAFVPSFDGPEDVPATDVERIFANPQVQQFYDHAEYRSVAWVRAKVPKKPTPADEDRARALADIFYQVAQAARPKTKQDYLVLARLVSHDLVGDVFSTARDGPAVPEFRNAAFALRAVGDISPPVRTQWGWDVLLYLEIYPERHTPRPEAEKEVRAQVFDTVRRAAFARWADGFVSRAKVWRNDPLLDTIEVGEGLW